MTVRRLEVTNCAAYGHRTSALMTRPSRRSYKN